MSTLLALRNFVSGGNKPARPAARISNPWAGWHAALRSALESSAQARARRELLDLADRYSTTDPELAKELRAAVGNAP